MAVSPVFAQVLAAGRAQFNARVTEARRRYPTLDTGTFAAFLQSGVDPVVGAVAAAAPDRAAMAAAVGYDLALELTGQGLAGPGARADTVNRVWTELAPLLARLVAEHPLAVLGALTNAAINVEKTGSMQATEWLRIMLELAPRVESVANLRALGQVAAWCAGLAHFRDGAIRAADDLPETLALAAFEAPVNARWQDVRERLLADPWWSPRHDGPARLGHRVEVGRFTGFGGIFATPPEVRPCAQGFFVRSEDRYSLLIADAYGAVLHPATPEEFGQPVGPVAGAGQPRLSGTKVVLAGGAVDLDLPAEGITLACNAHTVAVTSPYTFAIRLLPRL